MQTIESIRSFMEVLLPETLVGRIAIYSVAIWSSLLAIAAFASTNW